MSTIWTLTQSKMKYSPSLSMYELKCLLILQEKLTHERWWDIYLNVIFIIWNYCLLDIVTIRYNWILHQAIFCVSYNQGLQFPVITIDERPMYGVVNVVKCIYIAWLERLCIRTGQWLLGWKAQCDGQNIVFRWYFNSYDI